MIYYVFVLLAVLCFTLQFVFTKLFAACTRGGGVTAFAMLLAVGVAGVAVSLVATWGEIRLSWVSWVLALAFALVMVPYHTLSVKALSLGSLSIYSVFMMLGGMLLPFLYGITLLAEDPTPGKVLGCLFLVLAIVWQGVTEARSEGHTGGGGRYLLLCLVIFFINGMTGILSEIHAIHPATEDEASFLFASSLLVIGLAAGGLLLSLRRGGEAGRNEWTVFFTRKPILYALLLGIAMNTGNFLILLAAEQVPASVQFPLISGGTIVLSAIAAFLLFREGRTLKGWLPILIAFLSTLLFAF